MIATRSPARLRPAPAALVLLIAAVLAPAEETARTPAGFQPALSHAVTTLGERADRGLTAAESALLLQGFGMLSGDDRERARDALVRAWDARLERPRDPAATVPAADAEELEGLLDAWQASCHERFRQAAAEALGRAAADAVKEHAAATDLAAVAAALARGGAVLDSPEATAMAQRAERAAIAAVGEPADATALDALAHAALALYDGAGDVAALQTALGEQERLDHLAWDDAAGIYKTAAPFAALDLVRLGRITGDPELTARARRLLDASRERLPTDPSLLIAAAEDAAPALHLTLIGRGDEPGTARLLAAAHRRAVPGLVIVTLDETDAARALHQRFPGMTPMPRTNGAPTAYLRTDRVCDQPTSDPERLARRIAELAGP